MKYFLQSSDFVYNPVTFIYEMKLLDKLRTNRRIVLDNVQFLLRSDIIAPHCLFLCSNLAKLCTRTIYQSPGVNHFSDVVCLLTENLSGRYHLKVPQPVHCENKSISVLQFWVRDEENNMVDCALGGSVENQQEQASSGITVTDADVLAIPELRIFFPQNNNLDSSYVEQDAVGSSVRYVTNRVLGEEYLYVGYADWVVAQIGVGLFGIQSDANWQFGSDTVQPNKFNSNSVSIMFVMKCSTATLTSIEYIFDFFGFGVRTSATGQLLMATRATFRFLTSPCFRQRIICFISSATTILVCRYICTRSRFCGLMTTP